MNVSVGCLENFCFRAGSQNVQEFLVLRRNGSGIVMGRCIPPEVRAYPGFDGPPDLQAMTLL